MMIGIPGGNKHFVFFLVTFMIALLCVCWTSFGNEKFVEKIDFNVSLDYSRDESTKITIPVVRVLSNSSNIPIIFLGPGYGYGNIPKGFMVFRESFPNNSFYFIGYRGVESDISPPDNHIKPLSTMKLEDIDEKLLQKMANRTLKGINLNNFWIPSRAQDIIRFIDHENIPYINLLSIGEYGSHIAHELMSQIANRIKRTVFVSPVVANPHNDTSERLLGIFRRVCKKDSLCPYKYTRWLPDIIPTRVMGVFNINPSRTRFVTSMQIRSPSTYKTALESLMAITNGSPFGYMALTGSPGPEMMKLKWIDMAMLVCSTPSDNSLLFPDNLKLICPYLPQFHTNRPTKFETPILIISGDFDLPRPRTQLMFYKNNSLMPTIVDQIFLNLSFSRYELGRSDVSSAISSYLNDGNTVFDINQTQKIEWKSAFPVVNSIKYILLSGVVISLVIGFFIFRKSAKEEKKDHAFRKWKKNLKEE